VITLHAPATDENYHLLNQQAFSKMKQGVIIVNTSRGTLIDTDALIKSLEIGHTGGAALDVLEDEKGLYYINRVGDCIDNRQMAILRSFPNVLLTPHTAFYTEQTVRSMAENTVQCLFDMENNVENSLIIV
jgi:D-lactate dehydrogenase